MSGEFTIIGSSGFATWLAGSGASLAFTTYQSNKLFLLGTDPQGRLSVYERSFDRAMGIHAVDGQTLWLGTRAQLWRLENILGVGDEANGFDRIFLPRVAYTTGDVGIHEVHVDAADAPIFVSARFNCLARSDEHFSLRPLWVPPFIDGVVGEDRCHLNGLAMRDGQPRYVTVVAQANIVDGWRDRRRDGGLVLDVVTGEAICGGLSMPHSPRWYRDRLWLLDSGNGQFGTVDAGRGTFEPWLLCPGFPRGLAFCGRYAVIGLSLPRDPATFADLPIAAALERAGAEPRCGLLVVDLDSRTVVEWLRLGGPITELFDVCMLPGVRRPQLVGLRNDEILRTLRIAPYEGSLRGR